MKILLILSHGQAQVERGFSTNTKLLVENQSKESLIAQRSIHDHMIFHKLRPGTIKITANLQNHVKQARGRYFTSQKERSLNSVKSVRAEKLKSITDEIMNINQNIVQAEASIKAMKQSADEYLFEAENKETVTELKNLISKSTALKRAAEEKESKLTELITKKRKLMDMKKDL